MLRSFSSLVYRIRRILKGMGILTLATLALSVVCGKAETGIKSVGNTFYNGNLSGSCVAISPTWVIGVRHASGQTVEVDGKVYKVAKEVRHPNDADLVLLQLDGKVPNPSSLGFLEFDQLKGKEVKIVGCGRGGSLAGDGFVTEAGSERERRSAMNTIDGTQPMQINFGTPGSPKIFTSQVLLYDIDGDSVPERNVMGSAKPVAGEGGHADRDSGGGWFVKRDGEWKLVALCAYVHTGNAKAKYGFGSIGSAVYLNVYKDWIKRTISG